MNPTLFFHPSARRSLHCALAAGALAFLGCGGAPRYTTDSAATSGAGVGRLRLSFVSQAPGYQFGEVSLLVDDRLPLRPASLDQSLAQPLATGDHRLDAVLEYHSVGGPGEPQRMKRVSRSIRFATTPGCETRVQVVLERAPAQPPAVHFEISDCSGERSALRTDGSTL